MLYRTKQPCHQCMKDAGVAAKDINEVLLVGGMTRMPKVRSVESGMVERGQQAGGDAKSVGSTAG